MKTSDFLRAGFPEESREAQPDLVREVADAVEAHLTAPPTPEPPPSRDDLISRMRRVVRGMRRPNLNANPYYRRKL